MNLKFTFSIYSYRSFIAALFLLLSHSFYSKQDPEIEKAIQELKVAKSDTARCRILAFLSDNAPRPDWIAYNDTLISILEKAIARDDEHKQKYLYYYSVALGNKGFVFGEEGDVAIALDYHKKALELCKQLNDLDGIANCLSNLGTMYQDAGDIIKALEHSTAALKMREKSNNILGISTALNNIASVYMDMGQTKKALEYQLRAYGLLKNTSHFSELGTCLNNIGHNYSLNKDYETAKKYFLKRIELAEKNNDIINAATSYSNIGNLYNKLNQPRKALEYYSKAMELSRISKDKRIIGLILNNTGAVYMQLGDYNKALELTKECMRIADETNQFKLRFQASKQFYLIYKHFNNTDEALKYYEIYIHCKDSLRNNENRKATIKSQLKYEYEKKSAADSVKSAEEKKVIDAKLKQEKTQRLALYGGLGLVVIFALFMVNRFRITNKQKKLIEEQKKLVELQKHLVEEKQIEVLDSIQYAKRIQMALITNEKYIHRNLKKLM